MRKLLIGFVSLGAVLGVYLLYSRMSETPPIDTGPLVDFSEVASDSNSAGLDSDVGKIGDLGLGPVRKARYITLNPRTKEVEREWGFERLLHEVSDVWEIEKPYVNIYQRSFKCYITADRGQIQVETAVGRTTPKDATLSSNVVIHIVPEAEDGFKESFIYLDNIVFLSERSQISTAGPVRFVSEDVRMTGTGLELIYSGLSERVELFRIFDLESLLIRSSQMTALSTGRAKAGQPAGSPAEVAVRTELPEPNQAVVAGGPEPTEALQADVSPPPRQEQNQYYKCIFSKNVLINAPEQLIFADDKICISDILWSNKSTAQPDEADANGTDDTKQVAAAAEEVQQDKADAAGVVAVSTAGEPNESLGELNGAVVSAPGEPNVPSVEFVDIVVTCDNGFVLVPRDSVRTIDGFAQVDTNDAVSDSNRPAELDDKTGRTKFFTRQIDYNATTGDVLADGMSEVTFYRSADAGADANEPPVPVKITATQTAKYFKASNQVIFEGDCLCTTPQSGLTEQRDITFRSPQITVDIPEDKSKRPDILAAGPARLSFYVQDANGTGAAQDSNDTETAPEPTPVIVTAQKQVRFMGASNRLVFDEDCLCTATREDPNVITKYMLMSEQITVDLPSDANAGSPGTATGIRHLTASGGVVTLASTKTAKTAPALEGQTQNGNAARSLGGVELKCSRVDYDHVEGLFAATGPSSMIHVDNSKIPRPAEKTEGVGLNQPCHVFLRDFETLKYFIGDNRIVADAGSRRLLFDYFSVANGTDDGHITAEASRVEALLFKTPSGRSELLTATATGGIDYKDEDKGNNFIGNKLFYDNKSSIVIVTGDDVRPCYYNGILVDMIEYNFNTGKRKFEIVGPGSLQME
ncbi:MAG: hypothetical protein ABIF19_18340 [Planctomycetota bacterium]